MSIFPTNSNDVQELCSAMIHVTTALNGAVRRAEKRDLQEPFVGNGAPLSEANAALRRADKILRKVLHNETPTT